MAWKAKVMGIVRRVHIKPVVGGNVVEYEITVQFFLEEAPETKYVRVKTLPHSVTEAQVLAAIKSELSDLNAGDVLPTAINTRIGVDIDSTTSW